MSFNLSPRASNGAVLRLNPKTTLICLGHSSLFCGHTLESNCPCLVLLSTIQTTESVNRSPCLVLQSTIPILTVTQQDFRITLGGKQDFLNAWILRMWKTWYPLMNPRWMRMVRIIITIISFKIEFSSNPSILSDRAPEANFNLKIIDLLQLTFFL